MTQRDQKSSAPERVQNIHNLNASMQAREALDAQRELEPGTLTKYEDNTFMFTGDGIATPEDIMTRVIDIEGKQDPEVAAFRGQSNMAVMAAIVTIDKYNNHLKQLSQKYDQPIPKRELFHVRGGATLKQMLAPFKDKLPELKNLVRSSSASSSSSLSGAGLDKKAQEGLNRTTGNVTSLGLGLPVD